MLAHNMLARETGPAGRVRECRCITRSSYSVSNVWSIRRLGLTARLAATPDQSSTLTFDKGIPGIQLNNPYMYEGTNMASGTPKTANKTVCEKWWIPDEISPNDSLKIWRYMDLSKYLSLLHQRGLWLARADTFEDPYEGLINDPTIDALRHITPHSPRSFEETMNFALRVEEDRLSTFVNCWHWNKKESAAMWKLYSNNDYCIAVVSDISRLLPLLPDYVAFTFVNYIDWDHDCFAASNNSKAPYFHKRNEFSHENEVRIIYMEPLHQQKGGPETSEKEKGILLQVDLGSLVKEVVLAPQTPTWVTDTIKETTRMYGHKFSINVSSLLDSPR